MPEIDFQCGEFRIYKVNVEGVAFGFIDTGSGGYSPALGETFQYDGTTVVLRDGREFADITQLRKAIEAGWCVLASDEVTQYRPKAAGIQVRPTETKPHERPTRVSIETTHQEDREVVSVEGRRRKREATNHRAAQRVPLESPEGKAAMESMGDPALDEIVAAIDDEVDGYVAAQRQIEEEKRAREDAKAEAHADILEMFHAVERDDSAVTRTAARATPSARNLPVDVQEDRVEMPIVREDTTETGTVVGQVSGAVIEREEGIQLNIAPATPQVTSPKPPPRMGGAGAIVVDEQRHVSDISLSGGAAPIRLDESAKVVSGNTESIRMGQDAQVGTRKKAHTVETGQGQEGVAVSRVLSPTRTTFEANDANTSSSAIQRAQDGKRLKVERLETDDVVVGSVGGDPGKPGVVATGDVQEATAGDELTDVLPDAVTPPAPEVHRRPEDDPAYAAVKMMIPDFEWDKDRKVSERVAAALKHFENPMYVKGILAVETAVGREEIKKALGEELDRRQKAKKSKKAAKKD